jgi:hypothetical protein
MVVLLVLLMAVAMIAPVPVAAADGEKKPPTKDKGGAFERMLALLVNSLCNVFEGLFEWGGFKPLNELVFNDGLSDAEKKNLPWGSEKEAKTVRSWYLIIVGFFTPFFIFAVVKTAFGFFRGAVKPDARAEAKADWARWFIAIGIIVLAPLLVATFMWISALLVDAITAAFNQVGESTGMGRAVSDWKDINVAGMKIVTGSVFGTAVVRAMLFIMFVYLNALYIIRKITLTVFLCATPLLVILWCINKNSTAATIWIGELASNAFMPVAHGLALCTVMLLCDVKNIESGGFMTIVIFLYAIIPLAEALRNSMQSVFARWAGMNEEATAGKAVGAIMGMGGLMSMGRVGKATFGGGSQALPSGGTAAIGGGGASPSALGASGGGASSLGPSPAGDGGFGIGDSMTGIAGAGGGGMPFSVHASGDGDAGMGAEGRQISPTLGAGGADSGIPASMQRFSSAAVDGGSGATAMPQKPAGVSPAMKKAAGFGRSSGAAAAAGTGALLGLVAGAVPGGDKVANTTAAVVGRGTQVAATGAHLAGGYIADKGGKALNNAAQGGSGTAKWLVDTSQQVKQTAKKTWANTRHVLS